MSKNPVKTKTPKTQPAALLPPPDLSGEDRLAHLFQEARRHLDEADRDFYSALGLIRTSLLKAHLAGDCLLDAKELVDHGAWEERLAKEVGEESIRSAQCYMQIAKHWYKIQPALDKDPDLSIKDALRLLGRGHKAVPVDPDYQAALVLARKLFDDTFPDLRSWTDEELFVLQVYFTKYRQLDDVLIDEFRAGLEKVFTRLQSRVRKFDANRIGLDEKLRAEFLAIRAQRRKEEGEGDGSMMVYAYTKPAPKLRLDPRLFSKHPEDARARPCQRF